MPLAELGAFSRRQAKLLACRIASFTLLLFSFQKYNDIAWRQNCLEQFWTAAGRSRSDAGQGRPAQCHTPQGLWLAWECSTPA